MQAWMRIGQPLEPVMSDYKRILDVRYFRIRKANSLFLPSPRTHKSIVTVD